MPCLVIAEKLVPTGYVLRTVDTLHRAGAHAVTFRVTPPPEGPDAIETLVRAAREKARAATIRLLGEVLPGESPDLPPVPRLLGAFAGTIRVRRDADRPLRPVEDEIVDERIPSIDDPTLEEVTDADLPPEDPGEPIDGGFDVVHDEPVVPAPRGAPAGVAGGEAGSLDAQAKASPPAREAAVSHPVGLALDWLAQHQSPDGRWDADGFEERCKLNRCGGWGSRLFDPGVTGLALLAFLEAGQTHTTGRHRDTVRKGLRYLKRIQAPEGRFGPATTNRFTYNHAVATLAMAKAYGLTGSLLFRRTTQRGVDFIEKCRNPYLAWRYGVRPGDNGTSATAWMVVALAAVREAGDLRVPRDAFDGAKSWLDKVTEPEYGKVGYTARGTGPARAQDIMDRFPPDKSEALTAMGLVCRRILGEEPLTSEMIRKGAALCLKVLPEWNEQSGSIDMIFWFFGTRALSRIGGEPWLAWSAAIKGAVVDHQRKNGDQRGSWDPVGPWGREGGRIYSTALMALCLRIANGIPSRADRPGRTSLTRMRSALRILRMPRTPPPPDRRIDALVRAETLDALRRCHAEGPYPCPETELKARAAGRLKGKAPARGLRTRIGRALATIATLDRPRRGAPRQAVFQGDEDRLYALAPREILAAVEIMRAERAYPVGLPALGSRLRLTPRGRAALAERLLSGDVPDGLSLVLRGRTPRLTLAGEEGFGRALRKAEQLDLRIRLADLERGVTTIVSRRGRISFESAFTAAYDHLSREERSRFVPLPRLREALPAWDREAFDAGLVALCEADRYQLSEHEHPGRLRKEQRAASLTWGPDGRSFYFASRV